MTNNNESTEQLIETLTAEIAKEGEAHRFSNLAGLVGKLNHALQLEAEERSVKTRLELLRASISGEGGSPTDRPIQRLIVHVTQGMINQNLLTLTEPIKTRLIRVGENMHIRCVPSGDEFETTVLASGNKLQERGKIGKFYRDAQVKAGDVVELRNLGNHHWELRRLDNREYHTMKLKALEMV
jgi:hypothetical protein